MNSLNEHIKLMQDVMHKIRNSPLEAADFKMQYSFSSRMLLEEKRVKLLVKLQEQGLVSLMWVVKGGDVHSHDEVIKKVTEHNYPLTDIEYLFVYIEGKKFFLYLYWLKLLSLLGRCIKAFSPTRFIGFLEKHKTVLFILGMMVLIGFLIIFQDYKVRSIGGDNWIEFE